MQLGGLYRRSEALKIYPVKNICPETGEVKNICKNPQAAEISKDVDLELKNKVWTWIDEVSPKVAETDFN